MGKKPRVAHAGILENAGGEQAKWQKPPFLTKNHHKRSIVLAGDLADNPF